MAEATHGHGGAGGDDYRARSLQAWFARGKWRPEYVIRECESDIIRHCEIGFGGCMNVFELRNRLVDDYASYTRSFIKIADARILERVDSELNAGAFWPEPMLQLNPNFYRGDTLDKLVAAGKLDAECAKIFRIESPTLTTWANRSCSTLISGRRYSKSKRNKSPTC